MDQLRHTREKADRFTVFDSFHSQAWNMVTGPQARKASAVNLSILLAEGKETN